ncbi:hypothetical protein A6P39_006750 [Streptomyces sp. FXJ1.172]|uniref:hypothetical protein n=1 Tax=Streptomyces sp. FXJ1.172 TaxID=710705 RepID=UPI0007CF53B3|nr:hypothetical protein [Streptomyces sp. FXJ1.172]WEO93730.1 hypothetical protein A6P39_006750 [Streptomyces sp. FXJ1.172]
MNRALPALTLVAAALLSACTTGTRPVAATPAPTSPASAPPACAKLPAAVLPHSAGQLTQEHSGLYCLPRGRRVDVFLTAQNRDRWQPVQASGNGVLAPANTGVMTAPMGVTPAMFVGAADGTAVLTSTTAAGGRWRVTIEVEG